MVVFGCWVVYVAVYDAFRARVQWITSLTPVIYVPPGVAVALVEEEAIEITGWTVWETCV